MTDYEELYAGERVCCTCAHFIQHYRRDDRDGEERYHPWAAGIVSNAVPGVILPRPRPVRAGKRNNGGK